MAERKLKAKLNGYQKTDDKGSITANDTLLQAFSRIENNIKEIQDHSGETTTPTTPTESPIKTMKLSEFNQFIEGLAGLKDQPFAIYDFEYDTDSDGVSDYEVVYAPMEPGLVTQH